MVIKFKCFIGYADNNIIRPLCVKLPLTKYSNNGGKNISFTVKDDRVSTKYIEICKGAVLEIYLDHKF